MTYPKFPNGKIATQIKKKKIWNQKSRNPSTNFNVLFQENHFYLAVKHFKDYNHHIYFSPKWKVCWCFADWRPRWVRYRWLSSSKQNITTKSVLIPITRIFKFKKRSHCSTAISCPFHWKSENIKRISYNLITYKYVYKQLPVFIKKYNSDNGR